MAELTPTIRAALRGLAVARLNVAASELELAVRAVCAAASSEAIRIAFEPGDIEDGDEDISLIRRARGVMRELGALEVYAERWAEAGRIVDDTPPQTVTELLDAAELAKIREDLAPSPRRDPKS